MQHMAILRRFSPKTVGFVASRVELVKACSYCLQQKCSPSSAEDWFLTVVVHGGIRVSGPEGGRISETVRDTITH